MNVTAGNPRGTPLLSQLATAKNGLKGAQIALCSAVTALAEAERVLELAEAVKPYEGVEGKNKAQRDAKFRLVLAAEYTVLAQAENALTEAQCALEAARLDWELARYKVRALEAPLAFAA